MEMTENVEIWRGGLTSDYMEREKVSFVMMHEGYPHRQAGMKPGGVTISFDIASKGGGSTSIRVWLSPIDFKKFASLMIESAPIEAENAFLAAMFRHRNLNA